MDAANYEESKRIFLIGLEVVLRKEGFKGVMAILRENFKDEFFQDHLKIMNEDNYREIILEL